MPDEPDIPPAAEPVGYPGTRVPPVRQVLAAGFTHNDQETGARGFAAGGPLDQMEPGPDRREHQSPALRPDRGLWPLDGVQSTFGSTTEIMKEIVGRGLGL